MRYFIIVNPTSGHGLGEKSIPQIESSLRESGLDFTLPTLDRTFPAYADGEFICLNGSVLTLELFPLKSEIVYA